MALALLLPAGRAVAAEPASPETAKAYFEQGKTAYRDGRYADAIRAFSEADAAAPRAALSFDIARAYERLGEPARAIDAYRDFLRRAPDAPNADLVRARIVALSPDASESAPAAAAPRPLAAARERPALAAPREDAQGAARATFAPWSWLALGTGGALLVGAGVAELARRDSENDARRAPTQLAYVRDYGRMHDEQTVARVLFGVGGVLSVTGGVLLAIDLGQGRKAETRVGCLPSACFGGVEGSF